MTARNRWILVIVGFLAANVIAMAILVTSAGTVHLSPDYKALPARSK